MINNLINIIERLTSSSNNMIFFTSNNIVSVNESSWSEDLA